MTPSSSPAPRWTARLIVSAGIAWPLASFTALRRRGLPAGSPPPMRAATVISLISLVKSLPRLASSAPFFRLIVAHLEWPLIVTSLRDLGRCVMSPPEKAAQASDGCSKSQRTGDARHDAQAERAPAQALDPGPLRG